MDNFNGSPGNKPRISYHEFYADDFTPREHYRLLWDHIKATGQNSLEVRPTSRSLPSRRKG